VSRELLPVRVSPGIKEPKVQLGDSRQGGRRQTSVKSKVIYIQGEIQMTDLMGLVNSAYGQGEKVVLGTQLIEKDKVQTWLPPWAPSFIETFQRLERSRQQAEVLRNNGGNTTQIHFFDHLKAMYETDLSMQTGIRTQATLALLHAEVQSFMHGFDIWV